MKYKKILTVSMSVLLSLSLVGCSSASKPATDSSGNAVVKEMKGEDLAKIEGDKKEKENYLVIDVRDEKEYKEGHLKFAINIPVKEVEKNIEQISKWREKSVVVYCNTGKKSKEAADILIKQGFKDVTNAQGVKDYTSYELVKYTTLSAAKFQDAINEAKGVFLDSRDKKDYDEKHVKGAINVDVKKLDELEKVLPTDKNTAIYSYCYSGNKSSDVAQKLIDLGYTNVYNALDGMKEYDYKLDGAECCTDNNKKDEHAGHNHSEEKKDDKK